VLFLSGAVRLDITLVAFDVFGLTFIVTLGFTLPFAVVITVARVLTIADVLGVAVALIRAAGAVTVATIATTTIIVAVSTGRQLAGRTTGRGARAAATG
jgi:hypothetical protein